VTGFPHREGGDKFTNETHAVLTEIAALKQSLSAIQIREIIALIRKNEKEIPY